MEIRKGYKRQKQEEVLDEFGIKLRMRGMYEVKGVEGDCWLWFPHCETGHKGDYSNEFSADGNRLCVTPATEKGAQNMRQFAETMGGKTLVCLPKLDNGCYTFVGVFRYLPSESNPDYEVYEKVSDYFSDETGIEEKKSSKVLYAVLGVVAVVVAALCFVLM